MPKMKMNLGSPSSPNWVVMDAKDALTLQGKSASDFTLIGHGHKATDISIDDTGNKITATNVEGALTEVVDKANNAQTSANNAQTSANNAQTTANAALPKGGGTVTGATTFDNTVTFKDASGAYDTLANLKSSVSNGKSSVASAITGKGVSASGSDDFTTLSNKIGQISTGKIASASNVRVDINQTYSTAAATITVSNLGFKPDMIFLNCNTHYKVHPTFSEMSNIPIESINYNTSRVPMNWKESNPTSASVSTLGDGDWTTYSGYNSSNSGTASLLDVFSSGFSFYVSWGPDTIANDTQLLYVIYNYTAIKFTT